MYILILIHIHASMHVRICMYVSICMKTSIFVHQYITRNQFSLLISVKKELVALAARSKLCWMRGFWRSLLADLIRCKLSRNANELRKVIIMGIINSFLYYFSLNVCFYVLEDLYYSFFHFVS
jgi:hypothetical protein